MEADAETAQVQTLLDGALLVANSLSMEGRHLDAARITGLIQLTRALRERLRPPPDTERPPKLEAV